MTSFGFITHYFQVEKEGVFHEGVTVSKVTNPTPEEVKIFRMWEGRRNSNAISDQKDLQAILQIAQRGSFPPHMVSNVGSLFEGTTLYHPLPENFVTLRVRVQIFIVPSQGIDSCCLVL